MNSPYQKSHLSQVFLKTTIPCEQLTKILTEQRVDSVLEIGPGKGILTKVLLKEHLNVTCVEKDLRFVDYLHKHFEKEITEKRLRLINEDILKFDFDAWRKESQGSLAICGNIPYNISTPLLEHVLPQLKHIKISALLVQLEFAERVVSPPGLKSYGSLSVFSQLRANVKLQHKVDRSCFTPVPKVDSAILSLQVKDEQENETLLKIVETLTKKAFSQRRKKISNALSEILEEWGDKPFPVDLSRRPDTLSPQDYLNIAKLWKTDL